MFSESCPENRSIFPWTVPGGLASFPEEPQHNLVERPHMGWGLKFSSLVLKLPTAGPTLEQVEKQSVSLSKRSKNGRLR